MNTEIAEINDEDLKQVNGGFGLWDLVSAVLLPPGVGVFIDVVTEPSKAGDFPADPFARVNGGSGGDVDTNGGAEGSGGTGG